MSPDPEIKKDRIIDEEISEQMEKSFLDYAMSVIAGRALVDVRDGLKPVARRILFAMHGMGLSAGAKTKKSARVVGEVLGKYHPHGNASVYDAMVKLAQDFGYRYPLIIGQGNFGSVDGDPAAAERYTEVKLTKLAETILTDIEKDTVEFQPNYENTLKEPKVLPGLAPNLLLNGTFGIAVGMASNIPPHNMNEVCDAAICLIENKDCSTTDLLKFIKGPDFPLGGIAYDKRAIAQAYASGRGGVITQGEVETVEEKGKTQMIISSIPYEVNKSELISKIGDLIRDKKIEGVKDLRDESTSDVRIVLELKGSAQPVRIQNNLYKHTQLQKTFNYNMVGLVDGVPQQLNIHQILDTYVSYRRSIIEKRLKFDLAKAKARAHIVEGLKKALDHIDAMISLIRASEDVPSANVALMKKFKLSDEQAKAITDMRLGKLAGLERKKVEIEMTELTKTISSIESILNNKKKIDNVMIEEIKGLKNSFGDARRTKIVSTAPGEISEEDLIQEEQNVLLITAGGYVKRTSITEYKQQKRGGVGSKGAELKAEDFTTISLTASTHDILYFFTNKGKVYTLKMYDIPEGKRITKGRALANYISLSADERVTSVIAFASGTEKEGTVFFVTKKGIIKKVKTGQFENIRKTGILAISLESTDQLVSTLLVCDSDDVFMATSEGKSIRFAAKDVRSSGRSARGVRGIALKKEDEIVSALALPKEKKDSKILVIASNGYGKKTPSSAFKTQKRGGSGIKVSEVTSKTGKIVGAHLLDSSEYEIITMSQKGLMVRVDSNEIPSLGRQTQGVRIMRLKAGDKVCATTKV